MSMSNYTGNVRFVNNPNQPKCQYCGGYVKDVDKQVCPSCNRAIRQYKQQ